MTAWTGPLTIHRIEWHGWMSGWTVEWSMGPHFGGTGIMLSTREVLRLITKYMDEEPQP